MATVNLGRIKPVFRGAYNNSTAYVVDDIVTSGNETFIAIAATTGNATTDASKWTKLAAKGADGTDVAAVLANKEIAFKTNAGALDGIPIGTAGQFLKVISGATGYEFGTASSATQGQWKYLAQASITSDTSSIYMDNVFDHTNHDHYYLKVMNLNSTTASNNDIWLGLRTGGASGSHYGYDVYQARIRQHPSAGHGGSSGHQTDDYVRLQHSGVAGNSNVDTTQMEIYLYNISNKKSDGTADFHRPFMQSFSVGYSAGSPYTSIHYCGAFWDNASVDITGLEFKESGGNSWRGATRPLIYLYGQVKH